MRWWIEKTSGGFGVMKTAVPPNKSGIVRPEELGSMETDREIMRDLAITHLEGEGEWCLVSECHVGEDDDD